MMMICPRGEYLVKPSLEAGVKVCGVLQYLVVPFSCSPTSTD